MLPEPDQPTAQQFLPHLGNHSDAHLLRKAVRAQECWFQSLSDVIPALKRMPHFHLLKPIVVVFYVLVLENVLQCDCLAVQRIAYGFRLNQIEGLSL